MKSDKEKEIQQESRHGGGGGQMVPGQLLWLKRRSVCESKPGSTCSSAPSLEGPHYSARCSLTQCTGPFSVKVNKAGTSLSSASTHLALQFPLQWTDFQLHTESVWTAHRAALHLLENDLVHLSVRGCRILVYPASLGREGRAPYVTSRCNRLESEDIFCDGSYPGSSQTSTSQCSYFSSAAAQTLRCNFRVQTVCRLRAPYPD